MTSATRASPGRRVLLAALAFLTLLLSGCVYLRLLHLKRQLAAFDEYFTLETQEGLRLGCLEPVLLAKDVRWLGITPESTRRLGQAEQWRVRWVKEDGADGNTAGVPDVEIELIFTDEKLTRVHIAERYFALIPKEFLVGLLRGLGDASIDRVQRDAAVKFGASEQAAMGNVTMASLRRLLGAPSEQSSDGARTTLRYRYVPTPAGAKNGIFDISFVFDDRSGQLVFLQGSSPVGRMSFAFDQPADLRAAKGG